MSSYTAIINSPIGHLGLNFRGDKLATIQVTTEPLHASTEAKVLNATAAIDAYFKNPAYQADLDLAEQGTPFQQTVWKALRQIPVGQTLTYGALAKQLGTSPRAIGQSCRTNPLIILIPCHRIVGAKDLGGYSGAREGKWLDMKKWLLQHEGVIRN